MAHMTDAEFYATIPNVLPGGEAFHGLYWWIDVIQTGNQPPTGVIAMHDFSNKTFGAVLEHDSQLPGQSSTRCAVQINAANRTRDIGFDPNNTIVVNGFQDTIVCPTCGLRGHIVNKAWVSG